MAHKSDSSFRSRELQRLTAFRKTVFAFGNLGFYGKKTPASAGGNFLRTRHGYPEAAGDPLPWISESPRISRDFTSMRSREDGYEA